MVRIIKLKLKKSQFTTRATDRQFSLCTLEDKNGAELVKSADIPFQRVKKTLPVQFYNKKTIVINTEVSSCILLSKNLLSY
jgi:hypothetical protein